MIHILLALGFTVWGVSAACAWKDWYKSLCGLIVFTAISQHPDMPRATLGVPGLNPWNALFLIVLLAWMSQRGREQLRWDMPRVPGQLLLLGLGVEIVAFIRLFLDTASLVQHPTFGEVIGQYLIDPLKWGLVGLLLFDGCRDRHRLALGLASIFSFYVAISLQVLRVTLPAIGADEASLYRGSLSAYAMMEVGSSVGLHRNDVSVMLAGAFWAMNTVRPFFMSAKYRVVIVIGSLLAVFAQAMTAGRAGYLAWCAVGLTMGLVRWRRYLLLAPLLIVLVATILPSVTDRALHGLSTEGTVSDGINLNEVTAGRNVIWPLVIDKIWDAPFLGYGRAAMQRTGLSTALEDEALSIGFIDHPHNAYLEMLLDGGLVSLVIALALHGAFLAPSVRLLRDRHNPKHMAVGGVGLSVVLALFVGAFTGQSFWPRAANFGMWCAGGLVLRVWAERSGASSAPVSSARDGRPTGSTPESHILATVPDVAWWRRRNSPRTGALSGASRRGK